MDLLFEINAKSSSEVRSDKYISSAHVPALDGIRGLAVLMVFCYHYGGGAHSTNLILRSAGVALQIAWSGVTLFFVLSGFLISGVLWSSRGGKKWWRTFLVRRALRIFPLYYLGLSILFFSFLHNHTLHLGYKPLLILIFYLQNFWRSLDILGMTQLRVFHFWSLAVEEQFYLVAPLPLMSMLSLRHARQLCAFVILSSFAVRVFVVYTKQEWLFNSMPAHAGELATGAWLRLTISERPLWLPPLQRFAWLGLVGGVALSFAFGLPARNLSTDNPLIYLFGILALSVASAALILLALERSITSRILASAPLRHLGTISYGIYVFHILFRNQFFRIAARLLPHTSHNGIMANQFLVGGVLSFALAEISYRCFELPILNLKEKIAPSFPSRLNLPGRR